MRLAHQSSNHRGELGGVVKRNLLARGGYTVTMALITFEAGSSQLGKT